MTAATAVRVRLPAHLQELAGSGREVEVELAETPTLAAVLDSLERRHPPLRGTIRDPGTRARRAYIRYFACGQDLSDEPPDSPLPDCVASGSEPLRVVGAIAGG